MTNCRHEYELSRYCGCDVCVKCRDHKGLARGERLEDDIGDATWDGESWDVDY